MFWWWLLATVIIVVVGIWVVLASKMKSEILFYHEGDTDDDLFRVKLTALFGLVRLKYEVPVMYWAGIRRGLKIQREWVNMNQNKLMNEHIQKIDKQTLIKRYEQLKILLAHTMDLYRWLQATLKKVRCSHVVWETKIGLGDAPDTAICAGLIWGVKSSVLGYVSRYVVLTEVPRMKVTPLFNEEQFDTRFSCRAQVRLGFVVYTCLILAWRILRSKGGLKNVKRWRQVLSKA